MSAWVWLLVAAVTGAGAFLVGWPTWSGFTSRRRQDLNAERYLDHCLASIWRGAEAGVRVRHVVVDGASSDRTVEVARRYPSEVIVAKDGGMYEAVNNLGNQCEEGNAGKSKSHVRHQFKRNKAE